MLMLPSKISKRASNFPSRSITYGIMTEELIVRDIGIDEAATNESQKTLNKCETRNKTVFHTRLRHPETINSVPLNSVLRIKQIGV